MKNVKKYESWEYDAELKNYGDALWEYQGIYFVKGGENYLSVKEVTDDIGEKIADEIYIRANNKPIKSLGSGMSKIEADRFSEELLKLDEKHIMFIIAYIIDNFYQIAGKKNYISVSNFLERPELLNYVYNVDYDEFDTIHGFLGKSVSDAQTTIDQYFIGDEVDKFNL